MERLNKNHFIGGKYGKERCENCKLSWEFYYCGNTELRCRKGFDIATVNLDRIVNKASCGYYKPKQIKF